MNRDRLFPPDWLDTDTAAYMVSMSVDTFTRRVDDGTFPRPVTVGGKRLWHRAKLSEALERKDPAFLDADDPIMRELRGKTKDRRRGFAA
ncbi:hypothetical protein [Methylobacterium sp. yr596]|uniref:helix-turn-helix transcriptional regulator n=1 Tax=Methylobacterium sp. yr596 TaxID=1761800 RepID=UPI0008E95C54|nr:hypothetical protein [Methylobacterium sp. yr596]SFF22322.1 hypothetical protein SAMN04487844_1128 [Methylobacterium sp. yr596]